MKNKQNDEILHINPWKIIVIFLVGFLVLELIFFFAFQKTFSSLDESFFYYTPILFVATLIFCILSITKTTYKIEGTRLVHTRLGREDVYSWNAIIYIDEEYSESHNTLAFVTNDGKTHYLMFDKEGKIYEAALSKVRQISFEELQRRFPNIKL